MTAKRRLTEEEREQRRAQDRLRLKDAAEQLLTSEGWRRWVQVRARGGLARLSLNNQLLVALACPETTFVAGFKAWLKLGYCPVKGSQAIRIMAPMPVRERDPETGEKTDETRVLFKAVSVFDTLSRDCSRGEPRLAVDCSTVVIFTGGRLGPRWRRGVRRSGSAPEPRGRSVVFGAWRTERGGERAAVGCGGHAT